MVVTLRKRVAPRLLQRIVLPFLCVSVATRDFAALMCREHVSEHLFLSEILIYVAQRSRGICATRLGRDGS